MPSSVSFAFFVVQVRVHSNGGDMTACVTLAGWILMKDVPHDCAAACHSFDLFCLHVFSCCSVHVVYGCT